jgi:hypothetical protein
MASKTKQKKRRDPGKEPRSPRCGGEQPHTMDGGCCGAMSEEMKAACLAMMGRGCFPAEPPKAVSE